MKRHILALVGLLSLFESLSSNAVTLTNCNPAALPDNDPNGVLSIINTDAYFDPLEVVTSIYVTVAIDHTWVGDLAIELIATDGTELQILARPGADQPDEDQNAPYGDGSNLDPANPITFQDGAFPSAETLGAGVSGGADVPAGTYAPDTNGWNSTYTDFNGFVTAPTLARGNWTLKVADYANADTGSLVSWTLVIVAEPSTGLMLAVGLLDLVVAGRPRRLDRGRGPSHGAGTVMHNAPLGGSANRLEPRRGSPCFASLSPCWSWPRASAARISRRRAASCTMPSTTSSPPSGVKQWARRR